MVMGGKQLFSLSQALETRQRGYAMKDISKKLGLLYFGAVHHQDDDHDVIRGLTVSTSHKDKHYAVGNYDGYDIALVDRYDTSRTPSSVEHHNWCIIQISLRQPTTLPHTFLLPHDRAGRFSHLFVGMRSLQVIHDLIEQQYGHEFTSRYNVYAPAHQALDVEAVITAPVALNIGIRFWPHAIEIKDYKLFVYITEHRLNQTVLGGAIESALWLAETLDQRED